MTPQRKQKLISTLERRQPDLQLITDQVHKSRNLAALIRTCDAVGVPYVHSVAPKTGYGYSGTAKGSDRWVKTIHHETCEEAIQQARSKGMKVYAAHFSERAVDYRDVDYAIPCAILMGSEKEGVSQEAADMADQHILIPMMGMVGSLNVSTAAGIIMVEAQNQRLKAGLYNESRLDPQEFKDTIFEWSCPDIADFCRKKGLEYPPLDDDLVMADSAAWYQAYRDGTATKREW
ncbi:tRNA (guanosine(18)-2'-O)-methyltransferase TrmH [Neptunomonas japonica]|uniref:tRNA (guanosine(18)-2'-O)-methyltransferase n=1 Tax=Neptunomonas japonica JAMM 1380 TaxID=1441457 RepID=A0A7R6PSA5_9GAMM|nr:tRNA (guanosine(18)-2'-O)-methyltransferase TrmH [Neptunomonas japonica]BBB28573.1 tRNA (guanosine-2'-O-)-methyltransferase [Neptunomonas japonica JAMM 1380]